MRYQPSEGPAEGTGKLIHVAAEGDDLEIGALVAKIEIGASVTAAPVAAATDKTSTPTATTVAGHPSPAAAKIMREKGIAANEVSGTGRDGRITKEDAMKATTIR